jgi:3-phosphoshikimate 1-carboxyvinyltransferase
MTLALMQQAGINGSFSDRTISIPHQPYHPCILDIESDWSAASYFYGMVALSNEPAALFLEGLTRDSLQGDAVIQHIARHWGIETLFEEGGARIERKAAIKPEKLELDFLAFPDLGQTLIVMCALSGTEAVFSGLQSLSIKETNRLMAMKTEMAKISVHMETDEGQGTCRIMGNQKPDIQNPVFETYEDHRMAMALSMISATKKPVIIREPEVVRKSYPEFWESMKKGGFTCTPYEN